MITKPELELFIDHSDVISGGNRESLLSNAINEDTTGHLLKFFQSKHYQPSQN